MKDKIGPVLFCLAFAIPFGGVGLWASWVVASTLRDAWSAREWVKVRADVITADMRQSAGRRSTTYRADAVYRYTYDGMDYTGSRLGLVAMGSDNIGDWQEEMADFLQAARDEKRQITVFVNPAIPTQAVVDRAIPWPMMLFLTPFALGFGGVGVGALAAAWFALTKPAEGSAKPKAAPRPAFATDRPASFLDQEIAQQPFAPDVAIPPNVATIEERAGRMTIHYAGGILAAFMGRLTVVAGEGQLRVERSGLFGRKEFRVPQSAITGIAPALSYTVTSGSRQTRYYAITATTRDGERIPLGRGLPGEETANWLAARIAKALKLAPQLVGTAR